MEKCRGEKFSAIKLVNRIVAEESRRNSRNMFHFLGLGIFHLVEILLNSIEISNRLRCDFIFNLACLAVVFSSFSRTTYTSVLHLEFLRNISPYPFSKEDSLHNLSSSSLTFDTILCLGIKVILLYFLSSSVKIYLREYEGTKLENGVVWGEAGEGEEKAGGKVKSSKI